MLSTHHALYSLPIWEQEAQHSTLNNALVPRSERWEAWLPLTGGALTAAVFITLPTYFYLGRLPHMGDCGEDMSRFD